MKKCHHRVSTSIAVTAAFIIYFLTLFALASENVDVFHETQRTILFASIPSIHHFDFEPFYTLAKEFHRRYNSNQSVKYKIYFAGPQFLQKYIDPNQGVTFLNYGLNETFVTERSKFINKNVQSIIDESGLSSSTVLKETVLFTEHVSVPSYKQIYLALSKFYAANRIDTMILHTMLLPARDFAFTHDIPLVCLATGLISLPNQPFYVPTEGSGVSLYGNLYQRLISIISVMKESLVSSQEPIEKLKKIRKETFDSFDSTDPYDKKPYIGKIIYPTYFNVEYGFPTDPFVFHTGPLVNPKELDQQDMIKILPHGLKSWLEKYEQRKHNAVFINFGGTCITHAASFYEDLIHSLVTNNEQKMGIVVLMPDATHCINGGSQEKIQSALDKYKNEGDIYILDSHFQYNYLVEHAILSSSHVKFMIGYGEFQSIHRSLYHGKPVLLFPLHSDHFDIAIRVQDQKVGLFVHLGDLKQERTQIIKEHIAVMSSPRSLYAKQAQKSKAIFHRLRGLDKAVEIIEDTLELGNDHLIPVTHRIPLYQLYSLDVIGILFFAPVTMLSSIIAYIFCWKVREMSDDLENKKLM